MSEEMWDFDEDGYILLILFCLILMIGELFHEKCVSGFLPELFAKWKAGNYNHVLSIILFSRVYYSASDEQKVSLEDSPHPLNTTTSGRKYRDFYRVVVDWEVRTDWNPILIPIRREFMQFRR